MKYKYGLLGAPIMVVPSLKEELEGNNCPIGLGVGVRKSIAWPARDIKMPLMIWPPAKFPIKL